ncbi:MAG: helix-turn-helix domain-containing protein [Lachnospiraceae bacterium]|nr:helix-turn-helix domain-containing protein [Lachnospiraceae bacterium]
MDFGRVLKELREELKMKQKDLALALNLNTTTVNRWETGKSMPNRSTAMFLLQMAEEKGASTVCREALQETLFPSADKPGMDDLKFAQMDQINQMVNDSSNGVTVSELSTGKILYINRVAAEIAGRDVEEAEKMTCYEYMMHRDTPCTNCVRHRLKEDSYVEWEQTSSYNGRHYLLRGKKISWNGVPAHVEYITDATELFNTRQMLKEACSFAEIWTFIYEVTTNTVFPDQKLQNQFGMPPVVENFPEAVFEWGLVLPESISVYREMVQRIKDGAAQSEAEIHAMYQDGALHWLRFRLNTIQYNSDGTPRTATCSAQPIDTEKLLAARLEVERKKQRVGEEDLLGYVVTNLTSGTVTEHHKFHPKSPFTETGISYEQGIRDALDTIVFENDRIRFQELHERKRLLEEFQHGIFTDGIEFQRKQPDGSIMWVRNILTLLQEPDTGDILLCEYCYDMDKKKLCDGMMMIAVQYNFEFYGSINLHNNQIIVVDYIEEKKSGDMSVMDYDTRVKSYANQFIIEKDRESFLQKSTVSTIIKELEQSSNYEFNVQVKDKQGRKRLKNFRFNYFDKEKGICLVTRMDVTDVAEKMGIKVGTN